LITIYIKKRDLDIHNAALLEPVTIQDAVLNDINVDLKFNKDSKKDDYIGCNFLIERGSRIFEFIFIEHFHGFFKLMYDALSMRKNQCIFAIVNKGNAQALPIKYTLLYKKIPSDNGGKDRYSNREGCCICESLKDYSYFSPKKDDVKILWIYGGKLYEDKGFFELKEKLTEFIIVIEYISVPTKKRIIQAYKSVIGEKTVRDKKMNFLMEFNAMTKDGIDDMIEKTFAKKIKKYAIFE